ncbi:MAG: phenylalanine--tRNA ligase subunit beta [Crenarchaeota archaeon]|nr:phenylalanine--tRNA ligase subunit beta [Thermoproteota archaeon]
MPIISFQRWDLEKLVGTSLSDNDLKNIFTRLKGELEKIENDTVELEVTHDRPDMFSVEGIARVIKGLLGIETGLPRIDVRYETYDMYVDDVPWRRYVITSIVRDVELHEEAVRQLMQLQEKLHQTYGRDRKVVAIGLYDADKIRFPIRYTSMNVNDVEYVPLGYDRVMKGKEVLEITEKGQKYRDIALSPDKEKVPVIVDSSNNVLVIIPILNSELHKVTEKTRNIMIDVTGTDLKRVIDVYRVVVYNVLERSRSKIVEVPRIHVDYYSYIRNELFNPLKYSLDEEYVYDISGIRLTRKEIIELLLKARHDVDEEDRYIIVKVPPYRINVLHKVDVVEDILIMYGYDKIEREYPLQPVHGRKSTLSRIVTQLRAILRGMNIIEIMTYVMTSKKLQEICEQDGIIEVLNPKSELYNSVRRCIWVQLLDVVRENPALAERQAKLFDIGDVAWYEDNKVIQDIHLGVLITGRDITLTDILTIFNTLFKVLNINIEYKRGKVPGLIPERTGIIVEKNRRIELGYVGEVHPRVLSALEYYNPTAIGEISITKLLEVL